MILIFIFELGVLMASVSINPVARYSSFSTPTDEPLVIIYKKGERKTRDLIPTVKEEDGGLLGKGSFGKVYIHRKNPKLVVKKSQSDLCEEFEFGQLCHSCLTKASQLFIKLYPDGGKKFKMVMERIEGTSIWAVLCSNAPRLSPVTINQLLQDMKETIVYLFCKKIAWDDVRSDHMYVTPNGHLKICDMGLWYKEQNTLNRTEKLFYIALDMIKLILESSNYSFTKEEVKLIMQTSDLFSLPSYLFVNPWFGNIHEKFEWERAFTKKLEGLDDNGRLSFLEHYLERVIKNFDNHIAIQQSERSV
jgi:serine/threonine protein kinase